MKHLNYRTTHHFSPHSTRCQDGFRTSHEIQKINVWELEDLKDMVDWDAIKQDKHRENYLGNSIKGRHDRGSESNSHSPMVSCVDAMWYMRTEDKVLSEKEKLQLKV